MLSGRSPNQKTQCESIVMNRRVLISFLVITVVACVILSLVSICGAGVLVWEEISQSQESISSPGDRPSIPQEDGETLSPKTIAEMELIQKQVAGLRQLEPGGEFTRSFYTPEELRQRVLDDFLEDYSPEKAQQDAIVLAVFGLLDPHFDLLDFYTELLSEQIAGFYDHEAKEMVVVSGRRFGGAERLTYAHEYTHALQDFHFDISNGLKYGDEACEGDSERCAAIRALLEGDASLSEGEWFAEYATAQDRSDVYAFYQNFQSPIFDQAPEFISLDFMFPYDQGIDFAQYLKRNGGWEAVNQAYRNPPLSTEQILHPDRYPGDQPIEVDLPDLSGILGPGWEELDRETMGEWYTYLILAYGLDKSARLTKYQAADAAEGWGGDSYVVFHNATEGTTAMVLATVWDHASEARQFHDFFRLYAERRFGEPQGQDDSLIWTSDQGVHIFTRTGDRTLWVFAPSLDLANEIKNAFPRP